MLHDELNLLDTGSSDRCLLSCSACMFGLASDSGTTAGAGPRPTGVRAWRGKGTYQTPGRRVGVAFGVGTHSQSDAVTTQREKDHCAPLCATLIV